jgi:hypothetical protein
MQNNIFTYFKNPSDEVDRIFRQGRLTPQQWMKGATGQQISAQPLIENLNKVLEK